MHSVGDLSKNFSRHEFDCKHCGALVGPHPTLIAVLQRLRDARDAPLRIVSGTRCVVHNQAVGGSKNSQHIVGRAADIPAGAVTVREAQAAGVVGCGLRNGHVVHVDVRPMRSFFTFRD